MAVVEAHTKMKRVGHQYVGRCPFHEERTGSFCVNLEKGVYLCRGCQAAGDVITFVQESQHLDFVGAVETLAARAGVTLRYDDSDQSDRKSRKKTVLDLLAAVTEHYHGLLLTADEAKAARAYLRDRDFSSDTVRAWKLGYAPASRSEAWDAFRERTPWEIWEAAGLGYRDAGGATHDHFQDRVLFPIRDLAGNVIGFGGRVLPGAKDNRKYVNSPNGLVYQKSEALFGISVAKKAIVTKGAAIITEGYTDVTSLHAAGFDNAVAGCGTALTEEHLGVLCRFSKNVIAFYDSDSAGQEATAKVATRRSAGK